MGDKKLAAYFDLIPPEEKEAVRAMKRAEAHALTAVSKGTWAPDRVRARKQVFSDLKRVRTLLLKDDKKLPFDPKAVMQEVYHVATIRAEQGPVWETSKPKREKFKLKRRFGETLKPSGPYRLAKTFKLPKDVLMPITGSEKIDGVYRTYRNPPDPTNISSRLGAGIVPRRPAGLNLSHGGGKAHHEEPELAYKLQETELEDGPVSSRLLASYTINCLAADLQRYAFSDSDSLETGNPGVDSGSA